MAYENNTPEAIRETILANTGADVSKIEGGFASDMAAPVALEMSKVYGEVDKTLAIMFVNGAEGDYLDEKAGEYGLIRKDGITAHGRLSIFGAEGARVPAGTVVITLDGLRYTTDTNAVVDDRGAATVGITAWEVGAKYNVPAGAVTKLYKNIAGITGIINNEPITGGQDPETDEALRERLLIRMRTPATSGNVYHYQNWALETPGVGGVKVTPLQYGNGTVGVLIVGQNKEPVSPEVVQACADHIEEERPIGASVTVKSAVALGISISASILTDGSIAEIETRFYGIMDDFLQSIAFTEYTLSYNRVAFLLMSIPEILDYAELEMNGQAENIIIDADAVPVLEGVALSEIV